jgi:hypothetical protein
MFRINLSCYVEDKNLANGLVLNLEMSTQIVSNAVGKRGKVVDATGGGGDIIEVLKAYLKANKMKSMDAKAARAFQVHAGRSEQGYSALLTKAQEAGVLKKAGKGTKSGYIVTGAK